jgi:hypothetical protein
MFWGLLRETPFHLENHFRVSPLYPLSLLPTGVFTHYIAVMYAQLILSSAYYFSGLFPLYFLGRRLGGPRAGLLSALLFAFYPSSIYSTWIMSEALAIPIFLWFFWFVVELLLVPSFSISMLAGVAAGGVLLSRPQGLVAVPAILVFAGLCHPKDRESWEWLMLTGVVAALFAGFVWLSLGYLSPSSHSLTYFPPLENTPTPLQLLPRGLYQLGVYATALWMEGGLLFPILGILGLGMCMRGRWEREPACGLNPSGASLRLIAGYTTTCAVFLLVAVSFFAAYFLPDEGPRPVLRYAVYCNLLLIPFAAKVILDLTIPASNFVAAAAGMTVLFAQTLAWPNLWEVIRNHGSYFSNAPALDVYMQMDSLPGWEAAVITGGIGLTAVFLALRYRGLAVGIPLVLLLVVTRHALAVCIDTPRRTNERLGFSDIHQFCRELETERWQDTPIYSQWTPHVDYLARYVKFFTGCTHIYDSSTAPDKDRSLYLTFETIPDMTPEWEGKRLHAYRIEGHPE